jgi:choline dehydrogenase-like flavoprotein
MSVLGGNCVGGGSVVYFAAMPRAPRFVFERHGSIGRRMWPSVISRDSLEPWYDRVDESLPVSQQDWNDVSYAGGLWAAACNHSGRTANPAPVATPASTATS